MNAQECLAYASRCLSSARESKRADERKSLFELANAWTRIAAMLDDAATQSFSTVMKPKPMIHP
jgi:hypothetical protein